jgi:uncharacterized protein YgbK (DUF1537 family)
MLLGCIGDDFTGSSDLANTLAKQGMRTVQYSGVPDKPADDNVAAGVVALKSRSIPAEEAVSQSLKALRWLQEQGCQQFFYKYCSTFDSSPKGNIGPVTDALLEALGADRVIVCPAFPGASRSVYQGHLFVNDTLLSESGMQNHPLTPMTDSDIRRWVAMQTQFEVGHVSALDVFGGADTIRNCLDAQHSLNKRLIVVDAIRDEDLLEIGRAAADLPLITGGSGIAMGLPENFRESGQIGENDSIWAGENGPCVILSGSCSIATRAQVEAHSRNNPSLEILPADVIGCRISTDEVTRWLLEQPGVPLLYSSAAPEKVEAAQKTFGMEASSQALETFFADVAKRIIGAEVNRLIVAGGETSGAVVEALGITTMDIGPEIDPGVPAMRANPNLVLALKSGNFGARDFFIKAAQILSQGAK